jgi:hypothetical protein
MQYLTIGYMYVNTHLLYTIRYFIGYGKRDKIRVFQVNGRLASRFGHGSYLLNPSQFIINPLPHHSAFCSSSTESVVH